MTVLKKHKRALLVAAGFLGLVVLAVLVYAAYFDLNSWKPEIEAKISKATHSRVTIQGSVKRTDWFPLTVVVRGLQFQRRDEPYLTLENVECSALELSSLVRGRLRMGTCKIDGVVVAIVRETDGSFNFERTTERRRRRAAASSTPPVLFASRVIVHGGRYTFVDEDGPPEAEIAGLEADLRNFSIAGPAGGMRRAFSFKGELTSETLRRDALTLSQLKSPISAVGGRFLLENLSVVAFGSDGVGNFTADISERTPRFELTLDVPRCRVERVLEDLSMERLVGGEAVLAMRLRAAGKNREELTPTLTGEIALSGDHLQTYDLDVDKLIKKFDKTRGFNLFDIAAFFVAGPLGPVATKGMDFGRVYQQLGTGQGTLDRIVTAWSITDGVAEAKDCALATKKNRVALTGKIDLVHGVYQNTEVAVLDERGCSRYTEKLSGPVGAGPTVKKKMKALAGPFIGLFYKARHAMQRNDQCDVFYSGSVPHPARSEDKKGESKG